MYVDLISIPKSREAVSIRQELSAALNRSQGAENVRKWGERNLLLILFCTDVVTCSKCGNELVGGGGKCPMCRAGANCGGGPTEPTLYRKLRH